MFKGKILALAALALLLLPVGAQAFNPQGEYSYKQEGFTGTMTISQEGPGFVFAFDTTSKSNGQQCQFTTYETPMDQGGGRDNDELPAHGGTEDDGIKFSISFNGDTATVDVDSVGQECGMSGYFGGEYVKVD